MFIQPSIEWNGVKSEYFLRKVFPNRKEKGFWDLFKSTWEELVKRP